jgi:hypothetical protein
MKLTFALRHEAIIPKTDNAQITKDDMTGAAACIQGYKALCGFGITLMRNHIVEAIPARMNVVLIFKIFPFSPRNKKAADFSSRFILV